MKKVCGCTEKMIYVKASAGEYAHRKCTGCGEIYSTKTINKGYRFHIEGSEDIPIAFFTMKDIKKHISEIAKKYGKTKKEIENISYIITENEYQKECLI